MYYWIIDPELKTIDAWELKRGKYVSIGRGQGNATVAFAPFKDLEISPASAVGGSSGYARRRKNIFNRCAGMIFRAALIKFCRVRQCRAVIRRQRYRPRSGLARARSNQLLGHAGAQASCDCFAMGRCGSGKSGFLRMSMAPPSPPSMSKKPCKKPSAKRKRQFKKTMAGEKGDRCAYARNP